MNGKWDDYTPGSIISICTEHLSRREIENAIFQVLAHGFRASVDETDISRALGMGMEADCRAAAITCWADSFARKLSVTWECRQEESDLLFSLTQNTETQNAEALETAKFADEGTAAAV